MTNVDPTANSAVSAREAASAYLRGETFLDLRAAAHRAAEQLPRAVTVSSAAVTAGQNLPEELTRGPTYLVCSEGSISELASLYLRAAGVEAYSVRGGARALLAALSQLAEPSDLAEPAERAD